MSVVAEKSLRIGTQLAGNHIGKSLSVLVFVVHFVRTEHIGIVFVAEFGRTGYDDFRNGKFEIAFNAGCDFLVYMQHRSKFDGIVAGCGGRVEAHLVANLLANEQFGLGFVGKSEGSHDSVDDLNGIIGCDYVAICIKLHDSAFDKSLFVDFLARYLSTELLTQSLVLFLYHLFVYSNGIERKIYALVELDVYNRSQSYLVLKRIVFVGKVDFSNIESKRIAESMDALFLNEIIHGMSRFAVDNIAFNLAAETTAKLFDADVAFAEAGYNMGLADTLKFGVHFVFIIRLVELHHDFR